MFFYSFLDKLFISFVYNPHWRVLMAYKESSSSITLFLSSFPKGYPSSVYFTSIPTPHFSPLYIYSIYVSNEVLSSRAVSFSGAHSIRISVTLSISSVFRISFNRATVACFTKIQGIKTIPWICSLLSILPISPSWRAAFNLPYRSFMPFSI